VDIGAEPVQLTSDPKFEEHFPRWLPDGNTIAFTRQSGLREVGDFKPVGKAIGSEGEPSDDLARPRL